MEGKDVMGLAQTGTGKTAAFGLPIIDKLLRTKNSSNSIRALIITPTRELAVQTRDALQDFSKDTGIRVMAVFGGTATKPQIDRLKKGCDVLVACPGRLLDHMDHGRIKMSDLDLLVLDEADQMLDMGFLPAIKKIVKQLPPKPQTLLFSATMPPEVKLAASELLGEPVTIRVGASSPVETVSHALYPVSMSSKTPLLLHILKELASGSILVFTRTKHRAKRLGEDLVKNGHNAIALHGNLPQGKRQSALDAFRKGHSRILVATDIAARGIDVSGVTHVINYDMPDTADAYTHRIGRTGRASRTGDAYSFVTREDSVIVKAVERILRKPVESRLLKDFSCDKAMYNERAEVLCARNPREARRKDWRGRRKFHSGKGRSSSRHLSSMGF